MTSKSYEFRIYPNEKQKEQLKNNFGCCRFVYNYYLQKRIKHYQETKRNLNYNSCSKDLTELKKKLSWLKIADSSSLQQSLRDLDNACNNFFRSKILNRKNSKKVQFPKFKSKKVCKDSYKTHQGFKFFIEDGYIQLSKLGKVKCVFSNEIKGKAQSITVSQTQTGKYFVTIYCIDVEIDKYPKTDSETNYNLELKEPFMSSKNDKIDNPKYLEQSIKKLAKLQKRLSRKTIGSKNWDKQKLQIARYNEYIENQKKDFLQKLSTDIIKNNGDICVEDLRAKNTAKNHNLAKPTSDTAWDELIGMLRYKAKWHDKTISEISRFYPNTHIFYMCVRG